MFRVLFNLLYAENNTLLRKEQHEEEEEKEGEEILNALTNYVLLQNIQGVIKLNLSSHIQPCRPRQVKIMYFYLDEERFGDLYVVPAVSIAMECIWIIGWIQISGWRYVLAVTIWRIKS